MKKTAIVTGVARGLGRSIAISLAKEGFNIVGIDLAEQVSPLAQYSPSTSVDVLQTRQCIENTGARFNYFTADTKHLTSLMHIAKELSEDKDVAVQVICANAGIQLFDLLLESSTKLWEDTLNNNILGTFHTLKAFVPLLISNGKGKVIITSSTQGRRGMWCGSAYSASKWALIGMAKSAALELGKYAINVNVLVPGLIDTPMTRNQKRWQVAMGDGYQHKQIAEEQVVKKLSDMDPLGKPWLTPDEISPTVAYLASDAADHITGAVFDTANGTSSIYTA